MEDSADWTVKLADIANLLDAAGPLLASDLSYGFGEGSLQPITWGLYEAKSSLNL